MWQIEYFEFQPGKSPVRDFIQNLEPVAKAKIIDTFKLWQEFGIRLGLPHCKKLSGTPLYELRILGQNSLRIFYVIVSSQKFLLLHGFAKKTNNTPRKEIEVALKRLNIYKFGY